MMVARHAVADRGDVALEWRLECGGRNAMDSGL